jgi:hypothetical protein
MPVTITVRKGEPLTYLVGGKEIAVEAAREQTITLAGPLDQIPVWVQQPGGHRFRVALDQLSMGVSA